jgi:voltage-gated potassium channel
VVYVFLTAFLILITDESIDNYGDALWYCYAVLSTARFGDVVVTGFLPKILSVILTIYSAIVIAIVTGAIVNLYSQITEETNKETLNAFLDQLENLPELNRHELSDLSKRIQSFRDSHSK